MDRRQIVGYGLCAFAISNIHLHYMLVDAWRQRKKENKKNEMECFWKNINK
jgi:hypothetical protein